MGDMVTVCDRENPDSLKERMFYKLGTPILWYLGSKVSKNGYNKFLKKRPFIVKQQITPVLFCSFIKKSTKAMFIKK
jgi:hypothetical protein